MQSTIVEALCAGTVKPLQGKRGPSAIDKRPATGPVRITRLGLAGDEQADRRHHGGPDKALHHYPADHYAHWRAVTGLALDRPGWFGENIATLGWTEAEVCLGDRVRLGTALVELSHGRQPCSTLAARFGRKSLVAEVLQTGFTGWYWRVLEEGEAAAGQAMVLEDRPCPDWPLARLTAVLLGKAGHAQDYADLADHPLLAEAWRQIARAKRAAA